MLTFEKPKQEDYKNRLVAFIDVLGFESLVNAVDKGKESFDCLADILGFMKKVEVDVREQATHFKQVMESLEVTAISDSLIISVQFEPEQQQAALGFLYYLKSLQFRFVGEYKTLVRGYVCAGKMYHHDNVIFGAPYMKAHKSEKDVNGPKIAIDPEVEAIIQQAESDTKYTDEKELTRRDEDGWLFVNYMQDPNLPAGNTFPYSYLLPQITEWLWERLQMERDGVLEKYCWLKGYIDSLIRENKCPAAEVVRWAFPQHDSLTKILAKHSGRRVYFHRTDEQFPEYWGLFDSELSGIKVIGSAMVPTKALDENCDIRPEKISSVERFLIELGAYSAEAEKIICSKLGKIAKMKMAH